MAATYDELMARVIDAPDDDQPRLVLADWLAERGDSDAAELIAVQCALARARAADALDEDAPSDEHARLLARERELGSAQARAWRRRLQGLVRHVWLERGLPHRVSMRLTQLDEVLAPVLAQAPVRTARLIALDDPLEPDHLRAVAACEAVERLDGLELDKIFGRPLLVAGRFVAPPYDLGDLLGQPQQLLGLRALSLADGRLDSDALRLLGALPWRRLERLNLRGSIADEDGLVALLDGASMQRLRWLRVDLDVDVRGPRALARAAQLCDIDELVLRGLGDEGLALLAAAAHLGRVRRVVVRPSRVTARGMRELARADCALLRRLHTLELEGGRVGDEGAAALAALPPAALPRLRELALPDSDIGDRGAEAIIASPALGALRRLDLKRNARLSKAAKCALRARYGKGVCTFSR